MPNNQPPESPPPAQPAITLLDQKRLPAAGDSPVPAVVLVARRWWRAFLMLGGKDEDYEGAIVEAQAAKVEMEQAAREFETTLQNVTLTSTKCRPWSSTSPLGPNSRRGS